MKEFVLLFRMDIKSAEAQPSKEQMEIYMKSGWCGSTISQREVCSPMVEITFQKMEES